MRDLWQDVRFALRWLRRSPGFTAVAVASIALAVGIYAALFAVIDALLFRPLPVRAPDRLVSLYTSGSDGDPWNTTSYPDLMDLRAGNSVFEDMAGHSAMIAAINLPDRSRLTLGEIVTGNYFQLLGVSAALGRTLLPDDDRPGADRVLMISHGYWKKELGGDPDVVGTTIRMRGQAFTIVGVAPPAFTGMTPILSPDVWLPTAHVGEVEPAGIIDAVPSPGATTRLERRGYRWLFVKARLRDGVGVEQARANVDVLMSRLMAAHPQTNKDRRGSVVAGADVRLHPSADGPLKLAGIGLMIAVGLVLLVACANVAGMLLARASARQKEIAVRLALGAGRGRLVRQLVTESVLLALFGAGGGVLLAFWLTRSVSSLALPIPIPISLNLQMDLRVLTFAVLVSLVAGLAAGIVPALRASGTHLTSALKGVTPAARVGWLRWSLRDSLVTGQIAVTVVLLVVAGLFGRSLMLMQRTDVGFRTAGLAVLSMDPAMLRYDEARSRQFYDEALARVRAMPGVQSVALAARLPFSLNFHVEQLHVPGVPSPEDRGFPVQNTRVSPAYFATLGIPILEGRAFADSDTPESARVVIVNETFARRFWPGESALGKEVRVRGPNGPAFTVVGVSADHKLQTVSEAALPYIHFSQTQQFNSYQVLIARTSGDASILLRDMRRELMALEPNLVFMDNQTMEGQIAATLFPARMTTWLVGVLGGVGMLLAAVGLYGVIAYSVARRTREIGTRMALGARRSAVVGLILRQGFALAIVGLGLGAIAAGVATQAVSSTLYGVSVADPVAWALASSVVVATSLVANLIPAIRAARVDPTVALRVE